MSHVLSVPPAAASVATVAGFPAPVEPRPPAIGEESRHVLTEASRPSCGQLLPEYAVAMETSANDAVHETLKPTATAAAAASASWSCYDGGGAGEGGGGGGGGSPPCHTAASTPPYLRWAAGLRSLLNDKEGVEHFKTYLKEEDCPEMLNFWFACEGLKHQSPEQADHEPTQYRRLIVAMYKRFVRPRRAARAGDGDRPPAELPLSEEVRAEIAERIRAGRLDGHVFDAAQAAVEQQMTRTLYPNFLKSDYYIQLLQGSPRAPDNDSVEGSSCASSVCGGAAPPPPGLPTLHEEEQLQQQQQQQQPVALTRGALLATQDKRALIQPTGRRKLDKSACGAQAGGLPLQGPVNPYHTLYSSYNPVSRQDSELQSMSSEALTDDTCSRAGSSVDGRRGQYPTCFSQKRLLKRQHRLMKDSARQNQESQLHHTVIPRTQRSAGPASVDPTRQCAEFARLLSCRLERVIVEREMADSGVDSKRLLQDAIGKLGHLAVENEQEILDAHISKVFDSSHHTPARSGARSPAVAPGLARRPPQRPPSGAAAHRSRERDVASTFSADSGTVYDLAGSQLSLERTPLPPPGAAAHHHVPKSRTFPDYRLSGSECGGARSARDATRRSRHSLQDPDSGVSVVSTELLPPRTRPNDKVLQWMQQQAGKEEAASRHRARPAHAPRPPLQPAPPGGDRGAPCTGGAGDAHPGRPRFPEGQHPQHPLNVAYNSLRRQPARPPKPSPVSAARAADPADEMLCIAYTFCGEEVPYMTRIVARAITLRQFKQLMPKKGNYRYFFKTECPDFETGVIQEEVTDDAACLPLWEGKVHGQVMSRD